MWLGAFLGYTHRDAAHEHVNMSDKTTDTSGATEATAPSERAHNAGDGGAVAAGAKRFSAKRKLAIVQRLLRGEGLEAVSREETQESRLQRSFSCLTQAHVCDPLAVMGSGLIISIQHVDRNHPRLPYDLALSRNKPQPGRADNLRARVSVSRRPRGDGHSQIAPASARARAQSAAAAASAASITFILSTRTGSPFLTTTSPSTITVSTSRPCPVCTSVPRTFVSGRRCGRRKSKSTRSARLPSSMEPI